MQSINPKILGRHAQTHDAIARNEREKLDGREEN